MKDMLVGLKNVLGKEPVNATEQGESSELLLTLRLLILVSTFYYLCVFVNGFIFSNIFKAAIPILAFAVMLLVFVASFYVPGHISCVALILIPVLFGSILSLRWADANSFSFYMIVGIPVIFTSLRYETKQKAVFALLMGIVVVGMNILSNVVPFNEKAPYLQHVIGTVIALVFSILYLTIIASYFCMKFTQAEHKVYIYNRQLKKMASLDPLTNLMNRRGMADVLEDMQAEYSRGSSGLSVAIGDIDFFKRINDQYGHDCGDYILKSVADIFTKYMEDKGEICRWGGEEFLFAFTERNPDNVFVFLNDLRHTLKHTRFEFNGTEIRITMTFGLEEFSVSNGMDATIKQADEKLYLGKESGRDKVVY